MSTISTINGVACANIASFNGVDAGDIDTINGVDMCTDVTPDSVNWGNIQGGDIYGYWQYTTQQITGISGTISLDLAISGVSGIGGVYFYKIDTTSPSYSSANHPLFVYGFTAYTSGTDINLNPNEYLTFSVDCTAGGSGSSTTTVSNNSDGGATLDTFTNTWSCR